MTLKPFPGFQSFETHHCVTGSMLHIYHYHDHPLSEEMLFGLGSGLGFFYWHQKGMTPMLAGRGNVHRPGVEGLEIITGHRTGVIVERFHTDSHKKAEQALLSLLEAEQPIMIHVDMAYLPYFNLPEGYHFGAHVVVIGGYDPESQQVLLADRDKALHPISLEDLAQARGSKFKPFPARNTWYTFDFSLKRLPTPDEIWRAIDEVCTTMLNGPISNFGVRGIRKAAQLIERWPQTMDTEELRWTCYNNYIFIDAEGGTGGGIFRYMYGRFLQEAVQYTGETQLSEFGQRLQTVGNQWQAVASIFKRGSEAQDPKDILAENVEPLMEIADLEEGIWRALQELITRNMASFPQIDATVEQSNGRKG